MSAATERAPVARRVWKELESLMADGGPAPIRVLFATDGSEHAEQARDLLKLLPLPAGSAVHFVTVVTKDSWDRPDWLKDALREWALRIDEASKKGLEWQGVGISSEIREGSEAAEILAAADSFDADLIVLGSRGLTGLDAFLVGSVARNVAKHADDPVLIAHAPLHGLSNVVLAIDGSQHSLEAVDLLARFPLPTSTHITVVHIVRPIHPAVGLMSIDTAEIYEALAESEQAEKEHGEALAAAAAERLRSHGKTDVGTEVRVGDPASQILQIAGEHEADLIVAGARGVSLIEGLLTGSVADRLIKAAHCSVLITR